MARRLVIGVDGGGTKTLGAVADLDGTILAQAEVGSTNPHSNPHETVAENLKNLTATLLQTAGRQAEEVDCICLGMAGVDRPEDKPMIQNMIKKFLPSAECVPVNDGVIALWGGALKPVGVIVISGTGSISFGFNKGGERARAGGWGHILGDEGSGYVLALRALRAVCRAHDGRTGPTRLREIILNHFSFDRPEQLLGWIKDLQGSKAEIAALSPLVFQACDAGDQTALAIAQEEAAELAAAAAAVGGKLFQSDDRDWEIIVAGGNLRKSKSYFEAFQSAVQKKLPGINVIHPRKEPVEGAVLLALDTVKNRG